MKMLPTQPNWATTMGCTANKVNTDRSTNLATTHTRTHTHRHTKECRAILGMWNSSLVALAPLLRIYYYRDISFIISIERSRPTERECVSGMIAFSVLLASTFSRSLFRQSHAMPCIVRRFGCLCVSVFMFLARANKRRPKDRCDRINERLVNRVERFMRAHTMPKSARRMDGDTYVL